MQNTLQSYFINEDAEYKEVEKDNGNKRLAEGEPEV